MPLLACDMAPLVLETIGRPLGSFQPSLLHGWSRGRRIRSAALGSFSLCFTDVACRGTVIV